MAADWLQGPYVYALYEFYGFSEKEIGQLFIAGFGSSMIFGTVVGSFADKYGRKKNCILFGIIYALSCITKHFNNYNILMVGRLLGGIATSLLFSAFESWMVFEHNKHQYPGDLLSNTFSLSTFGNGIIAILAGLIANTVAGKWGFVAPFDTSLVLLIVEIIIVSLTWTENYGDQKIELQASFSNAWKSMIADPKIWLLGSIQSLFEGAMYIFVFKWTPSLASKIPGETIPHGFIFACFMVSVMIGSGLFKFLIARHKVENFSRFMFAVATFSLAVPIFTESRPIRLFGFFLFEVCCGIFWPCLGTMRGKYVPEEVRATIMNFFRVPLNLIVVLILLKTGDISTQTVFTCCTALLLAATLCQQRLYNLTKALADQHLQTALLSKEDLEETDEAPRFGGH
eukprot:CAMPEP_0184656712 /NCGR_PEP_ID=MMETSP0308-20130426/16700_1 /TAXON_ID=38269 /ORGANISM="Gloeochaete witrockiana, Strain SAG 46.84" /LENGTH=398 /DNA_ID=CAMNT_0027093957 /DNA_START=285 /DNA_END=1481 /DNA_ORIENTATION=-